MTDTYASLTEQLYPEAEAERAFLARLFEEPDPTQTLWRIHLQADQFADPEYALIYETCITLRDNNTHIDVLSVAETLPAIAKDNQAEQKLWNLYGEIPHNGSIEFYVDQIIARYRRRCVTQLSTTLADVARTIPNSNLQDVVMAQVEIAFLKTVTDEPLTTVDRKLAERAFGTRPVDAITPTPWRSLNNAIRGFRPGALYVLAGDTGLGKSAVALQATQALTGAGTALYVSMEMGEAEHLDRLIAQNCGIALDMVERQRFPAGPILDRVTTFVRETPVSIVFDDRSNLSAEEIRRVAASTPNLSGIVIDYLQLMDLAQRKGENLTDAIGRTTKALKNTARDLRVPVILLSQLNREAARNGRPTRHHLLASGAIANDADVILLLWREDASDERVTTVIVEKNRQGPLGTLDLEWQGEFVRAVDM